MPFFQRDFAWSQVNWDRLRHDIWQLFDDDTTRKAAVESQIDVALEWNCPPDQKIWAVKLTRNEEPADDRGRWPERYLWLFNTLKQFDDTFRQRIAKLEVEDEVEESNP